MVLATSALKTGTTSARGALKHRLMPLRTSKRRRRLWLVTTSALLSNRESKRSLTLSVRFTQRPTTLRSRLMFSARGSTNKILVSALSTMVRLAPPRCSSLTTPTRFLWERASTPRRSSMTPSVVSVAFAKTLQLLRTRPSPESEEKKADDRQTCEGRTKLKTPDHTNRMDE